LPKVRKKVITPFEKNELISSINQLQVLIESVKTIFLTVHPDRDNLNAFGHNIRNLLILACTEVEAQFKGILKENGYIIKSKYPNIKDYIKTKEPLRLDEYSVKLLNYPWLVPYSPFLNWEDNDKSRSLGWYDNYNAVKHNRAEEFDKGTLRDAITALSAIAVLLTAQYGKEVMSKHSSIYNFFELTQEPIWSITDYYIPPLKDTDWVLKKYF
jgi:hypothetical protein